MPESGPPAREALRPGRACPACGRRVPRAVATCRCGAVVPIDSSPEVSFTGSRGLALVGVAAGAVAIAGALYWPLSRTVAPTAMTQADETAPLTQPGPDALGAGTADVSPERRAWDALVASRGLTPPPAPASAAEPAPAAAIAAGLEGVVSQVMPAVVLVETSAGRGSGFFVRADTVLTNVHVVQNDMFVTLRRMDGSSIQARVESRSPAFDIAVLKVSTPTVNQIVIPLGSAKTLRPGQEVIIIGSALGTLQNSVTRGIVSGVRQSRGATLVQTDAAANPGNSGGPLLDRTGTAIGITTLGYAGRQGLNFAVAIDHARDILGGRQGSPSAEVLTLNDLRAPTAAEPSEADRIQEDGARAFLTAIERLSRGAGDLDVGWKRFRDSCYSSPMAGSFDREWFAVFAPRTMPTPVPLQCSTYFSNFKTEAERFSGSMRAALEDARRAGVLPGVIRDTLRSRQLQFEGWDR